MLKDKGGAAYGGGKVYLYCGRADKTQPYGLGKPDELPTVDDDCKPKDREIPSKVRTVVVANRKKKTCGTYVSVEPFQIVRVLR